MKTEEAIEHIQKRLGLLNMGARLTWSLEDRTAVSLVCMEAIQLRMQRTAPKPAPIEDFVRDFKDYTKDELE